MKEVRILPVSYWLGEDLEQHPLVIPVHEHPELLALVDLLLREHVPGAPPHAVVVVGRRRRQELEAAHGGARPHLPQRPEHVVAGQRDVLHPRAAVVVQVRLYLAPPLGAVHRLVERQQHGLRVVGEHHRVEAALGGAHVLGGELGELVEPGEPGDVRGYRSELRHVADDVVEPAEAVVHGARVADALETREEGRVGAVRVADEAEHDVAVELHLREAEATAEVGGLERRAPPAATLARKASAASATRSATACTARPWSAANLRAAPGEKEGMEAVVAASRRRRGRRRRGR